MKKLLVVSIAMAFVAFGVGMSLAGDYHYKQSLNCSDCHTMHGTQAHTYAGGGTASSWTPIANNLRLLKGGEEHVCLDCHDNNNGFPDVVGANGGGAVANGRSAGALNTVAGVDGYTQYMGHTIGSTDPPPGAGTPYAYPAGTKLECVNCHSAHGGTGRGHVYNHTETVNPFRNLRTLSRGSGATDNATISYNRDLENTANPSGLFNMADNTFRDVYELGSGNYDQDGVLLNRPNLAKSGFGLWCGKCHVDLHGSPGGTEVGGTLGTSGRYSGFYRHPTSGVNLRSTWNSTLYRVRAEAPNQEWGTQGTAIATMPTNMGLTCLSCHKAHGTNRQFGLIYALGNAPLGENGDGTTAKHLCRQCHGQGAD